MVEQPTRPKHPSGRPIERPKNGDRSYLRIPDDGFVTLRQRIGSFKDAIGFTVKRKEEQED